MDAKTKAIVAHITFIGWIIALVQNSGDNKEELSSFYIRQYLGLTLTFMASFFIIIIPILGWILGMVGMFAVLVFWIISLVGALSGEEKLVPVVGEYFQDWFKSL